MSKMMDDFEKKKEEFFFKYACGFQIAAEKWTNFEKEKNLLEMKPSAVD